MEAYAGVFNTRSKSKLKRKIDSKLNALQSVNESNETTCNADINTKFLSVLVKSNICSETSSDASKMVKKRVDDVKIGLQLPHKKRKLKKDELVSSLLYQCEICAASYSTQLDFFRHLQGHYVQKADNPQQSGKMDHDAQSLDDNLPIQSLIDDTYFINSYESSVSQDEKSVTIDAEDSATLSNGQMVLIHLESTDKLPNCQNVYVVHDPDDFVDEDAINMNNTIDAVSDSEWYSMHADENIVENVIVSNDILDIDDNKEDVEQMNSEWLDMSSEMSNTNNRKLNKKKQTAASKMDCYDEIFEKKTLMDSSEMVKDDVIKKYKCRLCGKISNTKNALQYHFLLHTGERPHQCDNCGKCFFSKSALNVHMRLHTGDKPYACDVCSRTFRQWGDLTYHKQSLHSDEKNHQCEFCGKDFARRYSLIIHRRIHTGERNYKCEFCDKTFRASTYLQDHRRIHTGEKRHECENCGKKFRVRGDLKRHWKIHQRVGVRPKRYDIESAKDDKNDESSVKQIIVEHC